MNTGLILVVLAAVLWGTSGIAGKYLINMYSLSALTIGAMRLLIGSLTLLTISKLGSREKFQIKRRHLAFFLLYGIAIASYQITYFTAVENIMVSIATLIALCTAPIFVAILSRIFLKEQLNTVTIIALLVSILGTALIIGIKGNETVTGINYWGYLLALTAGFSYGVYTLCGKKLVVYYPPTRVMSVTVSLGALILLPLIKIPGNLSWEAWGLLLYLGVGPTAIAYIIFTMGLKRSTATNAAIASLFEPLTSTTLSVILIGETFNVSQVLGALLLSAALLLLVLHDYFASRNDSPRLAD